MIKILHTGDLHLDSPFAGLDSAHSELRRKELRQTFLSLMQYVKAHQVDLLLIAGDLFDYGFVTRQTLSLLVEQFAEAAPCQIVIAPGNHDPYKEKSVYAKTAFPPNVHIFKEEKLQRMPFESLGVDVYGYAFQSESVRQSLIAGERCERTNVCNILCAHATVGGTLTPYAPTPESDLLELGCDYCALGHVHQAGELQTLSRADGTPMYYAYCGCIEGRDFGETGVKSVILLEAEPGQAQPIRRIQRLSLASRRYETVALDISDVDSEQEIEARIRDRVQQMEKTEQLLLRVQLTGTVPMTINVPSWRGKGDSFGLFWLETEDHTLPLLDDGALMHDVTIRGEFYRRMKGLLQKGTQEERENAAYALRCGLAAIAGEDITDLDAAEKRGG